MTEPLSSNQQALEQQLLDAIDRLHPGTDCDNIRLRDAIVCLINAARRPADETSPVIEARILCGGCRRDLTLTIRGLEKDGDKLVGFHCHCGHVTDLKVQK